MAGAELRVEQLIIKLARLEQAFGALAVQTLLEGGLRFAEFAPSRCSDSFFAVSE